MPIGCVAPLLPTESVQSYPMELDDTWKDLDFDLDIPGEGEVPAATDPRFRIEDMEPPTPVANMPSEGSPPPGLEAARLAEMAEMAERLAGLLRLADGGGEPCPAGRGECAKASEACDGPGVAYEWGERVSRRKDTWSKSLGTSSRSRAITLEASDREDEPEGGEQAFCWERMRPIDGEWEQYSRSQVVRIERAWRKGASRVRLRTSTEEAVPMEIFFVDMLQLDSTTGETVAVRRVGHAPWWRRCQRELNAARASVKRGEPRWETMEQYKARSETVVGASVHSLRHRIARLSTNHFSAKDRRFRAAPVKYCLRRVVSSELFLLVTIGVTVWQALWIAIDVDRAGEKSTLDVMIEYFFCIFFTVELLVRLVSSVSVKAVGRTSWLMFDAVCVAGSMIELIVIPVLNIITKSNITEWGGFSVLRLIRLGRIIRICRVFGASSDTGPFFKGLLSGMRSAAFIWCLLIAILFVFSVLMRQNSSQNVREQYFSDVSRTMLWLVIKGVLLDNVGVILELMFDEDPLSFFLFVVFVFLAYFTLLSMLIGAFCSVAHDVAAAEKDAAQIEYLRGHLETIVECYIKDEGMIGHKDYERIIANPEVIRTLAQCGTDMEELKSLEHIMFHTRGEIDFETFFRAIVRLRKGKIATVKDIMHVQDNLLGKMESIEDRLT